MTPGFSIFLAQRENFSFVEEAASSQASLPSAIRCSGTCRVILTTRGQLTWEEHTRPITQLVMLINVKVVLFTGLRGEPTGSKIQARHIAVRVLAVGGQSGSAAQTSKQGRRWANLAQAGNVPAHNPSELHPHGTPCQLLESEGLSLLVALGVSNSQLCASSLHSSWDRFTKKS